MFRSHREHGVPCVCVLVVLSFHFYSQFIQLLIRQIIELLQSQPELSSKITEAILVIIPAFVKVLRTVETILEYLKEKLEHSYFRH